MDTVNVVSASDRGIPFTIVTPTRELSGSLRVPFRSGFNAHVEHVRAQNLEWSLRLGLVPEQDFELIDGLRRCQFEQLAALVHHGCSREGLALITNLYTAIFVLDDMLDDARSMIGCTVELAGHVAEYLCAAIADEPRPQLRPDIPSYERVVAVGDAFADLATRLSAHEAPVSFERYVEGMRSYLVGCVMESQKRVIRVRTISDYVDVRLRISAVYPCLDSGAIVEDCSVPASVWNDPAFRKMRTACNLCVSYVNDVFSYAKESQAGEFSNIVTVHRLVHDMELEQALAASIEMNDRVVADYLEAKRVLCDRHVITRPTRRYIRLMENWMRGNFDWYHQQRTDRYTQYLTTAIPA